MKGLLYIILDLFRDTEVEEIEEDMSLCQMFVNADSNELIANR